MKENKQPILSICIPTWNRRYALQHTLKSIIDQDEFKSGDVEIVISDNVSIDETEVEAGKLCKKYKNIRYFRNKENIGGNPNINRSFSLGKGEYLRLLGSDSIIINGGIKETIKIIKSKRPDIIYYNWEQDHKVYFNKELEEYDRDNNLYFFQSQKEFLEFLGDLHKHNKKNFWYAEKIFTFASIRCMSKKFYDGFIQKIYSQCKNFDSNYFSQTILFYFEDVKKGIVVFTKPQIERYHINRTGYFVNFKIVSDLFNLYYFIRKKYGTAPVLVMIKSVILWFLRFVSSTLYKNLGKFGLDESFRSFVHRVLRMK